MDLFLIPYDMWCHKGNAAMFVRVKRAGPHEYLQIVQNRREGKKVRQTVIAALGRLDRFAASRAFDQFLRSGARFAEHLMVLAESSAAEPAAKVRSIGPALIFERLWRETGNPAAPATASLKLPGKEVLPKGCREREINRCGSFRSPDAKATIQSETVRLLPVEITCYSTLATRTVASALDNIGDRLGDGVPAVSLTLAGESLPISVAWAAATGREAPHRSVTAASWTGGFNFVAIPAKESQLH